MKQLDNETIEAVSVEDCAAQIIESVPLVMRLIRAEMRSHRGPGLTVPQFRALGFVRRRPGCSLSDVAEHLGLTMPTSSKMIDRLQADGLIRRETVRGDRRRVALSLTEQGQAIVHAAAVPTRARVAEALAGLSQQDLDTLASAMHILSGVFAPTDPRGEESP